MDKTRRALLAALALSGCAAFALRMAGVFREADRKRKRTVEEALEIRLPAVEPRDAGGFADVLYKRRSGRVYGSRPLTLAEAAALLFAAQGVNRPRGFRTAPSAGALYPLDVYLAAGRVDGVEPGIYLYAPEGGLLRRGVAGDRRAALAEAALNQAWMAKAPALIAICAVYERCERKYGGRAVRYTDFEAGAAAQNVALAAAAMNLAAVVVGAFSDVETARLLGAGRGVTPLALMPVGAFGGAGT